MLIYPRRAAGAPLWVAAMPAVFVVLWSSGFIGAKYGLPYAEPFTFLLWRFAVVTALLALAAWYWRAPWPRRRGEAGHIAVAGLLVHAGYLGGVFGAIHRHVSAGEMAIVAGLQPVLTAMLAAPILGERVSARQWAGVVLGFAGVLLVVRERIAPGQAALDGYLFALFAVGCMTVGTLYQKRFCSHMDLCSGAAIQFAASTVAMAVAALLFEGMVVRWTGEFIFALAWLALVLSIGAITLLYLLIRHGEAARVTSLFYLVPPVTVLMAYAFFGERLTLTVLIGMVLTVMGVALVVLRRPPSAET
jgi:drug/metabolite transporter (DMT)-like permease